MSFTDFFGTYSYFVASVVLLLIAGTTLLMLPSQRNTLFAAGLLCLPSAFFSSIHVPAYWEPTFLFHWLVGPEDLIFTTSIGTTTWFFAVLPFRTAVDSPHLRWSTVLHRYLRCCVVGFISIAIALAVIRDGPFVMHATVLAMIAMCVVMTFMRPDMVPLAVSGSVGYTSFHFMDVLVCLSIWPEGADYWNPKAQLPFSVLNVPAFELVWASAFGYVWPMFVAYACDVRWKVGHRQRRN